jgi:predicted transcriptional regulator of viral defense system
MLSVRYGDEVRHREDEPRARLWHRASQQRGYFTAAQALEDGYSYSLQNFHTRRGNWVRVDHGIYRFREFDDLPGDENDHLIRWTLWSGGKAIVSHATALGVRDLGIANPAEVHLTVPPGFRKRHPAVVLHRGQLRPDEIEEREGFRVTTALRAIVESADDGLDQDVIDSAVHDVLDRGLATRTQLLRAAQFVGPRSELAIERALHAERA